MFMNTMAPGISYITSNLANNTSYGTWLIGTGTGQVGAARLVLEENFQPSASCTHTHTVLRADDRRMTAGYNSP